MIGVFIQEMLIKTVFFTFKNILLKIKFPLKTYFSINAILWKKGHCFPLRKRKNISPLIDVHNTAVNFQYKIQDYFN